jgi:hypothetical protein
MSRAHLEDLAERITLLLEDRGWGNSAPDHMDHFHGMPGFLRLLEQSR